MAFWRLTVSNRGLCLSFFPARSRTKSRKCAQVCLYAFSNFVWSPRSRNTEWSYLPWYCLPACGVHTLSSEPIQGEVTVLYKQGLPVITVPLPSRKEKCRFALKPLGNTVADFMQSIRKEDKGIDFITVYSTDGVRIASSTSIESLMRENFYLTLNNCVYFVEAPVIEHISIEDAETLNKIKVLVARLHENLSVTEFQLDEERKLLQRLQEVKVEIQPFEKKKYELMTMSNRRTTILSWLGLGLMGMQFGILARLTWWEYSWDIMEPVTYFITYGTTMAMYAYFVVTRQEYYLPEVRDRQFLFSFYKHAKRHGLDVTKYNELCKEQAQIEEDLQRLRDPLQKHLPIRELLGPASKEDNS